MDRDIHEDLDLFEKKLTGLINECSLESISDTPDYILASYCCLDSYNRSIRAREKWCERPVNKKEKTAVSCKIKKCSFRR